ncbi:hypothetical protein CFIMG_008327RA00001 [Ceratocystis fimbriata CBS 114723]|uniref:Extracellular membrane protein CFEM domain-containing protein n=1 Tax=Ceratocystis fimbriata CBS 114723 TaxID=1035309 RepID=A0A2C5X4I1_9PEZI|nr:hypothetical protein CFIMG_008327RA00001 [Ceratocystis fimbriata CBS 114723]
MTRSSIFILAALFSPIYTVSAATVSRISCSDAASVVNARSSIITCTDDSVDACLARLDSIGSDSVVQECFSSSSCASVVDGSVIDPSLTCYLYTMTDDAPESNGAELRMRRRRPAPPRSTDSSSTALATPSPPESTSVVEMGYLLLARDTLSYDANCSSLTSFKSKVCTTESGTSSCSSTTITTAECMDGYLCKTGGCMKLRNSMDTAGIIVAICFASFIAISAGLICFYCCRERSYEKKMAARAEAEAIAKAAAMDRKKADRQPLMSDQNNPFQDQH